MAGTHAGAEAAAREAGEAAPPVHPNLSFCVGTQRLPSSTSIFQASESFEY